jgi:hypothetical protein
VKLKLIDEEIEGIDIDACDINGEHISKSDGYITHYRYEISETDDIIIERAIEMLELYDDDVDICVEGGILYVSK